MIRKFTAVVDFEFRVDQMDAEAMEELIDRIKTGEFFPSDVIGLTLTPVA